MKLVQRTLGFKSAAVTLEFYSDLSNKTSIKPQPASALREQLPSRWQRNLAKQRSCPASGSHLGGQKPGINSFLTSVYTCYRNYLLPFFGARWLSADAATLLDFCEVRPSRRMLDAADATLALVFLDFPTLFTSFPGPAIAAHRKRAYTRACLEQELSLPDVRLLRFWRAFLFPRAAWLHGSK